MQAVSSRQLTVPTRVRRACAENLPAKPAAGAVSSPSPDEFYYPYAGTLYLADSEGLVLRNWLKYGQTGQPSQKREAGHTGQLDVDKSHIFFSLSTPDRLRSENLAKALFAQMNFHVAGKKELIVRDIEKAKEVLRTAVANATVTRYRRLVQGRPSGQQALHVPSAGWAQLLSYPHRIGNEGKLLQDWLVCSLTNSRLASQLEKLGIVCTNCDRTAPEFTLDFIHPRLETWLSSAGYCTDDLIDPVHNTYAVIGEVKIIA